MTLLQRLAVQAYTTSKPSLGGSRDGTQNCMHALSLPVELIPGSGLDDAGGSENLTTPTLAYLQAICGRLEKGQR